MNLVEQLYEQMPPERQKLLNESNYLAANMGNDLLLEQFYLALDAMISRLQQLHPAIPCPSGCSRCCETYALPEVLPAEWELIASELAQLPAAIQTQITTAIQQSSGFLNADGQLARPRKELRDCRCPLLVDGRCAVYPVRPFDCRITGYGFSQAGERPLPVPLPKQQPVPYSCSNEQMRMLRELSRGLHPLEYMFMPQRERLWEVLQEIEPSGRGPERLLKHLLQWATEQAELIPDA